MAKQRTEDGKYEFDPSLSWCSCPAWRFQKVPANQRTCKHLLAAQVKALGGFVPGPGNPQAIQRQRSKSQKATAEASLGRRIRMD